MIPAIIVLALIVIGIYAGFSYRKKLKGGCCGVERSDDPLEMKVSFVNKKGFLHSKTIKIKGMSCEHCKKKIEDAFNKTGNVYLQIDLVTNNGQLYYDGVIDDSEIITKIENLGYSVIEITPNT